MNKIFFVLPAYNEEENIKNVIMQWYPVVKELTDQGCQARLVIANDGSKDNTFKMMQELQSVYPLLEPLDKPNSGHGSTVLYLYRYAIENGCDYVFQTDSDGQTSPDEFWPLWNNRDQADFNIGTRQGRKDGFGRVVVTKVLRFVVWLTFGVWVKDANTPFRLMKVDRLKAVLEYIPQDFFLSNVAISAIAVKKNERIQWFPITFKPRQGGVNSINMKRIMKIGMSAWGDFLRINRSLKQKK
jgi:glycosyltransferase involved in cell wall biosynthesis